MYNARSLVDSAWDMEKLALKLAGVEVKLFVTSRLVSGADVERLITVD